MLKKVKNKRAPVEVPSAAVPVVAGYRVRGECGVAGMKDETAHLMGMPSGWV